MKSVEHKDAEQDERKVNEINSGMYMFKAEALSKALGQITNDNVQGEYYLPDTLSFIREDGYPVEAMELDDYTETLGVNNKVQLFEATSIMRKRINYKHMESGVTMVDANQVYIGKDVIVEADVIIYPGTSIEGKSVIKAGTHIGRIARLSIQSLNRMRQLNSRQFLVVILENIRQLDLMHIFDPIVK